MTPFFLVEGQKPMWRRRLLKTLGILLPVAFIAGVLIGGLWAFRVALDLTREKEACWQRDVAERDARIERQRREIGVYLSVITSLYGKKTEEVVNRERAKRKQGQGG